MEDRFLTEILASHADQMNEGAKVERDVYLAMFPRYRDDLAPLLALAERVKGILVPMTPPEIFRDELRQGLLAAAGQRVVPKAFQPAQDHRREIIIGAAALGSLVSLASVIAFIIRSRYWRRSQPIPSG